MLPKSCAVLAVPGVGALSAHGPAPSGERPIERSSACGPKPMASCIFKPSSPGHQSAMFWPSASRANPECRPGCSFASSHHTTRCACGASRVPAGKKKVGFSLTPSPSPAPVRSISRLVGLYSSIQSGLVSPFFTEPRLAAISSLRMMPSGRLSTVAPRLAPNARSLSLVEYWCTSTAKTFLPCLRSFPESWIGPLSSASRTELNARVV